MIEALNKTRTGTLQQDDLPEPAVTSARPPASPVRQAWQAVGACITWRLCNLAKGFGYVIGGVAMILSQCAWLLFELPWRVFKALAVMVTRKP